MKPAKKLLLTLAVVVAMGSLLMAKLDKQPNSAEAMMKAANALLGTLNEDQNALATFKFGDEERLNWHFIPRVRKGLALRDLFGAPKTATLELVQTGLSEAGYDQALKVMSLEEILFISEGGEREERREKRDPEKYYISIFGKPSATGSWGWRFEGHHLSLNFTIVDGELVSSTPEFFGANPGTVNAGVGRSIRILAPEEDLARQILTLCTAEQEEATWIEKEAPKDMRGGGVAQPDTTAPVGLPVSKMSPEQQRLMKELLSEYLQNMPADVEHERRARINKAGIENIYFAWWGSAEQNKGHYYRVQGPTFLIEYNNTQNNANHIHSIWRNLAGDFNVPITATK